MDMSLFMKSSFHVLTMVSKQHKIFRTIIIANRAFFNHFIYPFVRVSIP